MTANPVSTLDRSHLFSTEPGTASPPEAEITIERGRIRQWFRTHPTIVGAWAASVALVAAIITLGAWLHQTGRDAGEPMMMAGTILGFGVLCWLVGMVIAGLPAHDPTSYWHAWGAARGFTVVEDAGVLRSGVPAVRGERRTMQVALEGTLAGHDVIIGRFTTINVVGSPDRQRSPLDDDADADPPDDVRTFTFAHYLLPPAVGARFAGLSVNPRPGAAAFGSPFRRGAKPIDLDELVTQRLREPDDREIRFESNAFERRFEVRATRAQDEIAVHELLDPATLELLTTHPTLFGFQVSGEDLVVLSGVWSNRTADLEAFLERAAMIHDRFLREDR